MKIVDRIVFMLSTLLFAAILTSCSEFMLIPISIDYPFDEKNEEASPSSYKIDMAQGLAEIEGHFNNAAVAIVNESSEELLNAGGEIVEYPKFTTEDILDLISGNEKEKPMTYRQNLGDGTMQELKKDITFSICQFENSVFESDEETTDEKSGKTAAKASMSIKNIKEFCSLDKSQQQEKIAECSENLNETCLHLEVVQENESLIIKMAEQKDLKKYKKLLNKIYSATLTDFTFTLSDSLVMSNTKAFQFHAELYAQKIAPFKKVCTEENPDKCRCSENNLKEHPEECEYVGINENNEIEKDYFNVLIDKNITGENKTNLKYLVGVLESENAATATGEVMNLFYTYDGRDVLQKALKHLDLQLGLKSYYAFYPQALKPEGIISAKIKAKLLFNVEPIN